jgi:hypothetical protein
MSIEQSDQPESKTSTSRRRVLLTGGGYCRAALDYHRSRRGQQSTFRNPSSTRSQNHEHDHNQGRNRDLL